MKSIAENDKYLLQCVKRLFADPFIVTEGEGPLIKDNHGTEYIDLFNAHGVNFIGHKNPKIVDAVKKQVDKIIHYGTDLHTAPAAQLAEKLTLIVPPPLKRCYFGNSGSESIEVALHLARRYTSKHEIIGLYGAFHGRTYGARSAVGWAAYKERMGPYLPGFAHIPSYYCYRCSLGLEYPNCNLRCAKILEDALLYQVEGQVAAFIAEPVLGTAGNIPPPPGYFEEIAKILKSHDILFIADEVFTGLGRTGKLFCIQHFSAEADIMTLAKTLGGGLPISATISSERVASAFDVNTMLYFTTYGANPVCCAAALAVIDIITQEKVPERAQKLGEYFLRGLRELAENHELIGDVRGMGLMIGVELVKDKRTKLPARKESIKLRDEARKRGVILPAGQGWLGNTIRLLPSVAISTEQIDKALLVIEESLKAIE